MYQDYINVILLSTRCLKIQINYLELSKKKKYGVNDNRCIFLPTNMKKVYFRKIKCLNCLNKRL